MIQLQINQHIVLGELPSASPKATPFYKAMQLTRGAVSVLDGDAIYFSRIWCVFEIALVLNDLTQQGHRQYLHDFYTVAKNELEAAGVIDHVIPCNQRLHRQG